MLCRDFTKANGFTEVIPYDITPDEEMEFFNKDTPAPGFPSANYHPNKKAKE
jgi:hypothetical protein